MKTFWIRTASAAVYVLLFLGTLYSGRLTGNATLGHLLFTAFLLFVAVGCTYEFFRMVEQQGARPCRPLGYLYVVGALLMLTLPAVLPAGEGFAMMRMAYGFFPVLFALSVIVELWRSSEQPFREAAYTMVPLLYAAIPLALMSSIASDLGENALLMVIAMVWVNDSGAYIGGSLFGKHKMWPRHSPGKTWEGTAFGVLVAVLVAVFVGPLLVPDVAWPTWLAVGLVCSVVATLGDLVESMLKRSVGVKDSGNIMPGHGGFLDRFDSLLIITPFVYIVLLLLN